MYSSDRETDFHLAGAGLMALPAKAGPGGGIAGQRP